MTQSRKRTAPLWKISTVISTEAEEAVTELFEKLFGQPASVYTHQETGRTTASVYVSDSGANINQRRDELIRGLDHIRRCGLEIGSGRVIVKKVRREDWAESWKRHFKPFQVGCALLVKPSWSKRQPARKQAVLVLDPGLSFGTGQHPTTRFCLEELAARRPVGDSRSFLDIGTGSGILAIAAVKLGYSPVECFDFDPEAVRVARANARQNGVADKLRLSRRDLTLLPSSRSPQFDLVCANLIYDLLIDQKARILARLKPGGALVLAGILRTQFPAVRQAYAQAGLKLARSRAEKEWRCGVFVPAKNP